MLVPYSVDLRHSRRLSKKEIPFLMPGRIDDLNLYGIWVLSLVSFKRKYLAVWSVIIFKIKVRQ